MSFISFLCTNEDDAKLLRRATINNSFEWQGVIADGKFEPSAGENVVDMGLRGLISSFTISN